MTTPIKKATPNPKKEKATPKKENATPKPKKETTATTKKATPEKTYTTKEALVIIKEKTGKTLTGKQYRRILRSQEKYNDGKYTNYQLSYEEIMKHCTIIAGKKEESQAKAQ
jgi:hypothetical protein